MRASHIESSVPGRPACERVTAPPETRTERLAGYLGEALSEALRQIADELFHLAGRMQDPERRSLHLAALRYARDERETLCSAFTARFRQGLQPVRGGTEGDSLGLPGFDASALQLLDKDDWHRHQAVTNLAERIRTDCGDELYGLAGHIEPGCVLDHAVFSIGPEAIAQAVMDAYDQQTAPPRVGQILFTLLERHWPARINAACRTLGRRPPSPLRPPERVDESGHEPLLELPTGLAEIGEQTAPTQSSTPAQDEAVLLARLHALQCAQLAALDAENGEIAPNTGLTALLEESGLAQTMGHRAGMIADMISMLFDYIRRDPALPEAMKALLCRLQVPILSLALQDNGFFRKPGHPARRLLDDVARAALVCVDSEALQLLTRGLVRDILAQPGNPADGFARACAVLQGFLAEEERRSADVVQRRERTEIAAAAAEDEVRCRLEGLALPEVMRSFLIRIWRPVLAMTHEQAGPDGRPWKEAIQTMDDLLWSLVPKRDREERERLLAILPGLLQALDAGFRRTDTPQTERDRFFAALVKCHADAMRVLVAPPLEKPPSRETRRTPPPFPSPEQRVADPRLSESRVVLPADLVRGSWIEYRTEDGQSQLAKLAWISPHGALCLFVDPQGERTFPISAARLADGLEKGTIRIVNTAPLTDRAVKDILRRVLCKAA